MSLAVAVLLVAALVSWLVAFVSAIRFARAYAAWRRESGGKLWCRDPGVNIATTFDFIRSDAGAEDAAGRIREHGRRVGAHALVAGALFAFFLGLAVAVDAS